jgi:hypothetical protein
VFAPLLYKVRMLMLMVTLRRSNRVEAFIKTGTGNECFHSI